MSVEVAEPGAGQQSRAQQRGARPVRLRRGTNAVYVIELTGAPGAGKTTVAPALAAACAAAGLQPYTIVDAARPFAARTLAGRLVSRLPEGLRSGGLWGVYRTMSAAHTLLFMARHPRLTATVVASQRGRSPHADATERRVMYWYLRLMGSFGFLRAHARGAEALILDEGFVHRTVQLFASSVEAPSFDTISRYVDRVPRPDLVVQVAAAPTTCQERVRARGVWDHLADRPADDLDRFVMNAHRTVALTVAAVRQRHWPVAVVPNDTGSREAACAAVRQVAIDRVSNSEGRPPARRGPLPTPRPLYVPRPTRLIAGAQTRVRSDIHDRRWHEELLAPYGLQLVADPKPVSFGARNAHTVLHTSDGAMVLRRYRGGWHLDTVLHEHAVLRRLAELDFPAVRVVTTSDGATFVRRGEQLFALFERSPGISYWSTFMTHRGRQRLHREAGRTLGVMHTALRGYVPDVEHHVNIQAASSGDASGVEWHLAALEWLTSTTGDDEYAHPHERDLVARARYATQRLVDLDTTLQRADLPRVMIHGDYGLHNLLFADDGSAIVCDFELARLDLRLVDLVIAMSRIIVESGRSFLHGYCSAAPIPPDELRLLPTVWQFYHLTAAVRSWHNYRTIAGIERLATARRRLIEAERVHREGLVPRA